MQFLKFGRKQHDIHYEICPINPQGHYFRIKLHLAKPDKEKQQFWMPAWVPGSYKIRDFSQYLVWIKAYTKAGEVTIEQLNKNTWEIRGVSSPVTLEYEVYAYDLSVRGSYLDTTRGFFNGACVFLGVKGQEDKPHSVDIQPPKDKQFSGWEVATSLDLYGAKRYGYGVYQAKDYDDLIDHPVEISEFDLIEFEVMGVPHAMALAGKHKADCDRLGDDLTKLCTEHAKLFGGVPKDIKFYVFLTTVVGEGYGGLEHRSSSALIIKRENLPHKNVKEVSDKYAGFLSLCSHEYFHTWNIKRIKPEAFLPYDLNEESYTRQLWIFEGFTDYYEDVLLVRSGIIDLKQYCKLASDKITKVYTNPGYQVQSVTDSSFCCWTKFYNPHPGSNNMVTSYYTKGSMIAWCVDIYLREHTKSSLDTIVQRMWKAYGEPYVGVPEGKVESMIIELAGKAIEPLLYEWLYEAKDLPLEATARACGMKIDFANDPGDPKVLLGIRLNPKDQTHIVICYDGSCAKAAGISADDKLIAIDHLSVKGNTVKNMLSAYHPGDVVPIHVFRNDELLSFEVELADNPPQTAILSERTDASVQQKQLREQWLYSGSQIA